MSTIGIGLIGTGGRLRGVVQHVLKHSERFKVVAAYDPAEEAIATLEKQLGYEVHVCPDFQGVVDDPQVQYVMIGSWNCFHAQQAIAAFAAGKPVFCEKPLATTLEDCLAVLRAKRASGLDLTIGFTLRYSPFYRKLKELLASGVIGDIISMEFNETLDWNHGGYIHRDWRRKRDWAGTHLLEKCCHDVDLVNWMIGSRASRVASFGGTDFFTPANAALREEVGPHPENGSLAFQTWHQISDCPTPFNDDKDIIDNQVAIVEFENGVRTTFHTNCMSCIPERRMYINGNRGTIRGDVLTGLIELRRLGWNEERESINTNGAGGHGGGDEVLGAEVAASILHGAKPAATLEDGLRAAVTCFGIDQAMDEGRVVSLADLWAQVDAAFQD